MTRKDLDNLVPSIARNELFYFAARISMLAGTMIGLPVAGFMGARIVAQNDKLQDTVADQVIAIKILNYTLQTKFEAATLELHDHEIRIRHLEQK